MLPHESHLPQHFTLARERHQCLLEEARRYRESLAAVNTPAPRPARWRRLRVRVGDLLIHAGQRLKADATGTVWG